MAGLRLARSGRPRALNPIGAWPYTQADLETAKHPHELPRRDTVTLSVDLVQLGLGGDNSWGARPHPEYTPASDREYHFAFTIRSLR